MKYNLNHLLDYVDMGLVIMQNHPTLPLSIYNYSRECQYNGNWDEITVNCRGLILDIEGNVIAKPFPKFFNWEEHIVEGSKLPPIPNEPFQVYEKMDGSLGIIFYYERKLSLEERYNIWFNNNYETGMERFFDPNTLPNFDDPYYEPTPKTKGEWHIASKGSFTSEQAIKGKEMLDKSNTEYGLIPGYTYLVEIIYPKNRIVVDYGDDEKLVVLGCYNNETGKEGRISNMTSEGWEIVKMYKTWGEDWETLKREISKDNEGYVIRFQSGFRMKLKGDVYLRLHRIVTNFSTRTIWEILKNGEDLTPFLERVPDEFDTWVKEVVKDLQTRYDNIRKDYANITIDLMNKVGIEDKKAFAELALPYPHNSILFSMYNGKVDCMDEYIWKLLKPKYEKAFKKDEE
jgi:RNA ligase